MNFNYGYEKKVFEKEWAKKKALMIEAGMSEEAIEQIYEFDWDWFKSIRRYENHTTDIQFVAEIENNQTTDMDEGLALIEQIGDLKLLKAMKSLKAKELELLEKLIIEEKKQIEIAMEKGMSKSWINEQVEAVKQKIKRLMDTE